MNKPRRLANLSFPKALAATELATVRGGDGYAMPTSTTTAPNRSIDPCFVEPCFRR